MNRSSILLATLVSLAIGAALPAAAQSHEHHHEAPAATLQLDAGGAKGQTDKPVRQAMGVMRTEFAGKLHAIHTGSLGKDGYAALGKTIEAQIAVIVSNCKLGTKADAMLHIVIGELMQAADVLQGKAAGEPAPAAHQAVEALNAYGKHFRHPGWRTIG